MVSRRRHIKRERGAALFIVVLVILSLTGVAIFAARSASMDIAMAGRYRQAAETREIARLGLQLSFNELARDPATYMRAMKNSAMFSGAAGTNSNGNGCDQEITKDLTTGQPMDTGGCYRFAYDGIRDALRTDLSNASFELMAPGDVTAEYPGSLGYAGVRPNFGVQMTDKVELSWPVSGFTGDNNSNMRFYAVTMTSTGQIVPRASSIANDWGALTPNAATAFMASVEGARAEVVVGPLPQGL